MAYVDYAYYTGIFCGTAIGPDAFPRLANLAAAAIDAATMGRAANASGERLEAVRNAACAMAEVLQDAERMHRRTFSEERLVQSETVGNWSRNYGSQAATSTEAGLIERRKREVLQSYLGPYGLLRLRGRRI